MSKISKSPDRNTFQRERYLERQSEKGKTPENDTDTQAMVDLFDTWNIREDQQEADPEWRKNNLEWDLRTTDWILEKARASETYAQNLYAAMCNNDFQKINLELSEDNTAMMLKDGPPVWHCSWRYAGGIVAHMLQSGDYIDWYCSGIRDYNEDNVKQYVAESVVTDEIKHDLEKLGWVVVNDNGDA